MGVQLSTPYLTIVMDDGAVHHVQALNADLVRWDRTRATRKWPKHDEAPFLWMTFIAWCAMRRRHLIADDITFDQFEQQCLSLRSDEDPGDAVDPTRQDPGAG